MLQDYLLKKRDLLRLMRFFNYKNKDIKSIEDELNKALIEDLILAERIYQSNISNINMMFNSGISKVLKGQCINRNLPLWKVSTDTPIATIEPIMKVK